MGGGFKSKVDEEQGIDMKNMSVMDSVYDNGMKIKEIIELIETAKEAKEKDSKAEIKVNGLGFIGC